MNVYDVRVTGIIRVIADTHDSVRECLNNATLECAASRIRFLNIEKITFVEELVEERVEEHAKEAGETDALQDRGQDS